MYELNGRIDYTMKEIIHQLGKNSERFTSCRKSIYTHFKSMDEEEDLANARLSLKTNSAVSLE